jgi:3-oxoacyl-[acyl-carrier protein] reductase
LLETDEAGFDRLMAVNVRSVYLFVRYGLPLLERSDDPAIVNIGSIIGLRPRPHLTWYSTSKGAVNAMTQALAIELAGRGIRVNGLCPVATETEMLSQLAGGGGSADLEPLLRSIPLGRFAKPSDVASGVCFLASPDAAFLTGVNIPVDGGRAI